MVFQATEGEHLLEVDAGRCRSVHDHPRHVDARATQGVDSFVPEGVIAHGSHPSDPVTQTREGERHVDLGSTDRLA